MNNSLKKQTRELILNQICLFLKTLVSDSFLPSQVNEQTNLIAEFGIDSVEILQLILEIEKKFNIIIKDYELDMELFSKMGNLIDIIEGKLNESG